MRPERARHELHDSLKEAIGDDNAGTLMEMLPPFPWDEIAKRSDVVSECDKIRTEIDAKFVAVDGKLNALYARMVLANLMMALAVAGLVLAAMSVAR